MLKVKIILPRDKILDVEAFGKEAVKDLNDVRLLIKEDFEDCVKTWKDKPVFKGKKATESSASIKMWGDKNTWVWTNLGTDPHIITPKRAKRLAFKVPSSPKTTPNRLGSRRGGRGNTQVFAKQVRHPGTKARNFHIVSAEKRQKDLNQKLEWTMRKYAK